MRLRKLIASKLPSYELCGEVNTDESFFAGVRKENADEAQEGKQLFFGLLERCGKVYMAIVSNVRTETLLPIIQK